MLLEASELEILNAVVKWGEQALMRRLEEREPNLIATTTHSISRKGLRRSDLSDEELKEILAGLMPLVRTDYILPPFHQALLAATTRGLVSSPPADLPGTARRRSRSTSGTLPAAGSLPAPAAARYGSSEAVVEGGGLGNPDGHWLHPHAAAQPPLPHRRTPRPRFFEPYYQEAIHQLHKRLQEAPDTELLGHEPPPIPTLADHHAHTLPDALYMLKPSAAPGHAHGHGPRAEYALEEERWASSSSEEDGCSEPPISDTAADLSFLASAKERVGSLLRSSATVRQGLACGCAHHRRAVLRQVRLRALREAGLPDAALRILRRPAAFPVVSPAPASPAALLDRLSLSSEGDPLGPLDLGYATAAAAEPAWPDLMSSASLGREGDGLRQVCQAVSAWSANATAAAQGSKPSPHFPTAPAHPQYYVNLNTSLKQDESFLDLFN